MCGQYSFIVIGILSGIVGWVYSAKLTDTGMILNWWYVFADNYLPKVISKPLATCYKCVSGQIGLWSFWILSWSGEWNALQLFASVVAPCLSILTSIALNKKYSDET